MKKHLLILFFTLSLGQLFAQSVWNKVDNSRLSELTRVRPNLNTEGEMYFTLNQNAFKQTLVNAQDKFSNTVGVLVEFPNAQGEIEQFRVWENSNFEPALQAQFPDIRAYVGKSIVDGSTVNFSFSPEGVQTVLFRTNGGSEYIEAYDRNATAYVLFTSENKNKGKLDFKCTTIDEELEHDIITTATSNKSSNAIYKTMKLALSCTAEYSNYFGATSSAQVANVTTAFNNTMTRVNGVLEKDLCLHLNIIANTTSVIYYDAATDPYSDAANMNNWNTELKNNLTTVIGTANYDIGHLFGATGGGGNAGCIGCVCNTGKGSGYTSPGNGVPAGDTFDIDYVVHEMGHQLGANHTFTCYGEGNFAGTKLANYQVEPGSGSTIMGYAGITAVNVQANSNDIFSYKSISQIQTNLISKTCPVPTPITATNATPVVSAGADYTIPMGTAFMLTGTATDATAGDVLTHIWEQSDINTTTTFTTDVVLENESRVLATKTLGPNFRVFKPNTRTYRYFPQMSKILNGTLAITTAGTSNWESVNNTARTLNFSFTARDNHAGMGQTNVDAAVITVNTTGGPFAVTSQATTGISYPGNSSQTVTWNVANTTAAPFNTANVDILISTNVSTASETINGTVNATTFTTIASNVPNNGSAIVTLPNVAANVGTCRFMVKAVGNVFLAVNSKNFTITPALATDSFGLESFTLYPNPNNGSFTVSFNSNSSNDISIMVHDIRGREIANKNYSNTGLFEQTLQLNNAQAGVYLVTVKDGDRKEVKKIIIE